MSSLTGKVKLLMVTAALGLTALGVGLAGEEPKPAPAPPADVVRPAPVPARPGVRPAPPAPVVRRGPIARALAMEASHLREQISATWFSTTWFETPKQTINSTPKLFPGALRNLAIRVYFTGEPIEPPPSDCVTILYPRGEQGKSASKLIFTDKRLTQAWVTLLGPLDEVLENDLPHEMTHVVMAEHFGKALPRWADEGMACMAESRAAQARYDQRCRKLLEAGQGLRLATLFNMTEYPKDTDAFTAQAHSVTRFLLGQAVVPAPHLNASAEMEKLMRDPKNRASDHIRLLNFVWAGTNRGWDKAVPEMYRFANVNALEAAWIDWLKTPESRLAPDQPRELKPPATRAESERIPPVKLSGGR
jgi:hypothetical protein